MSPTSSAESRVPGDTYEWAGTTYCKCPHCGGLDVSYLGRDGLDICGTCHGTFVCQRGDQES